MSLETLGIDAYQLTTLLCHAELGRLRHTLDMSFFFRRLPPQRNFVVFAGLRRILEHAGSLRLDTDELDALLRHPVLGQALSKRTDVVEAMHNLDGFDGEIDALPEGTLAFAGDGYRTDGSPLEVLGTRLRLYVPLLNVRTDMLRAKLIETPWLGYVNYMSMVASKAARIVSAAEGKPVLEFGSRRTHPRAALDAAYAAYLGGSAATSNMAAYIQHGVPALGTMDHFAVQASEQPSVTRDASERAFFGAFVERFPHAATLLVDTYDTQRGIRSAVEATGGKLSGIRIDSNVTVETVAEARALLAELGVPHVKILVSDGLDERKVSALAPHVDGFGVGENLVCSPDSPVGVGAVAKLVANGYGSVTMKLARGSGKATLPGRLQAYRFADHDRITLADEPPPAGGTPLLAPVWRGRKQVEPLPSLESTRQYVQTQLAALPADLRSLSEALAPRKLVASDRLCDLIQELVGAATH